MSITVICRLLRVSTSGYYDWRKRMSQPPSGRAAADAQLIEQIRLIHGRFAYYGAPRIRHALAAQQIIAGRHRIARLMRLHGLQAQRGKPKSRPRSAPPSRRPDITDRVQRRFNAPAADRLWFTDLTVIRTGEGFLHAAVVLDAYNREVISWSTSDYETPKTVMTALREAIAIRRPTAGCVIHSDRGYQFTSGDWNELAQHNELVVSIGEQKSALDNAAMESWFASLKTEDIHPAGSIRTRDDARSRLFDYIWEYNNHRLHSTLGYRSPINYAKIRT